MRSTIIALAASTVLLMAAPAGLDAQGNSGNASKPGHSQGQDKDKDKTRGQQGNADRGQGQARGQGQGRVRGQSQAGAQGGRPTHARGRSNRAPDPATFNRNLMERAVEARSRRNGGGRDVEVRRGAGKVRFVRDDGEVLFELDESAANELGYWRVARVPTASQAAEGRRPGAPADRDRNRERDRDDGGLFGAVLDGDEDQGRRGPPAFCRSGEGHPVWGRSWCVDKGFGLGEGDGVWGWDDTLEDVMLRTPDRDRAVLDRGGLIDVLGDIVFGRIALQSLVLGADEPVTGRWMGRDNGPRVLRITAGDLTVAEMVDADRDDRVDAMVFNLGG